jgi:hypothetical protein
MCPAAPKMKNSRKTALIGTSGMIEGTWPKACEVGRYGGASCTGGPCCSGRYRVSDRVYMYHGQVREHTPPAGTFDMM